MQVTIIQTALHWEDKDKNLAHFDALVNSITEPTDLIVLPEMFSTGYSMAPEKLADAANGKSLQWMAKKAKEKNAVICGSVPVEENKNYFNRLFWVMPDGSVDVYNKRHLFRMAGEDRHYAMGHEKIIKDLKGFKICPLVCYDLRFPVWSRNTFTRTNGFCTAAYDVLIYVANWPEARTYPWKQLLIARAIENQCYVIGVNRIGEDGNGIKHSGDSMVINPRGEIISKTKANEQSIETITLDRIYLEDFRKAFPVGLDADDFKLL
jgi:omega-amidase